MTKILVIEKKAYLKLQIDNKYISPDFEEFIVC